MAPGDSSLAQRLRCVKIARSLKQTPDQRTLVGQRDHFQREHVVRFLCAGAASHPALARPLSRSLPIITTAVSYMDRASQVLEQGLPPGVRTTYAALSEQGGVPLSTLHHRAHGRRSKEQKAQSQQYLTPSEEKALLRFLLRMSDLGNPVRIKFLPSLAFSIARQRSSSNKAVKVPGRNWAQGFERRHPALKSRRVRAMDWNRHDRNIYEKITHWFEVIGKQLQDEAILPENVYNMDETGVMLSMLSSVKVLVGKDDLRDYRGAGVKRTMVTAIECISGDGRSLFPMIIWPAATHRSNWTTHPTPGWHFACSESGYTDSKISLEWIKRVFDPQTKPRANQKPRVLVCDGFGTHQSLEILEYCFENDIILCRLPSHTSHKLQPCDVGVFAPLKAAYRNQVERLYRGGAGTIGKEHFTYLYSIARKRAFTQRNIAAGWAATGLFPFNPDRVLKNISKPPSELIIPKGDEVTSLQVEVLQTPVTPVSAEALASLQNLIKQDAHTLDETSKQRLQRHLQKLASAAQIFLAERALLRDENRFLARMNNEAKVRRSTKSVVLGKAKVMSYEDIEEARAKRAAKEQAAADKANLGRKRKNPAEETAAPESAKAKAARTSEVSEPAMAPMAWMSKAQETFRAPVARMSETQVMEG